MSRSAMIGGLYEQARYDLCCIVDLLIVVMATHFCSILSLRPGTFPC